MQVINLELILPKYRYTTPSFRGIIENEFCPVFVARAIDAPKPNPEEVESFKWMEWQDFITTAINDHNDIWSWWCKDQVKQLQASTKLRDYLV
jgi:isopentenyl-diphosphate delta-isomerase